MVGAGRGGGGGPPQKKLFFFFFFKMTMSRPTSDPEYICCTVCLSGQVVKWSASSVGDQGFEFLRGQTRGLHTCGQGTTLPDHCYPENDNQAHIHLHRHHHHRRRRRRHDGNDDDNDDDADHNIKNSSNSNVEKRRFRLFAICMLTQELCPTNTLPRQPCNTKIMPNTASRVVRKAINVG